MVIRLEYIGGLNCVQNVISDSFYARFLYTLHVWSSGRIGLELRSMAYLT